MTRRSVVGVSMLVALIAGCRQGAERKNGHPFFPKAPVILISIDTLRADRLPAYGYAGVATPALDAFRKDAILYESAWSHVPLTLPAHVAMLTGKLPPDNGVRSNLGYTFEAAKFETIGSSLKKEGYATGAAVSSYVIRGETGIAKAFDFYDDAVKQATGPTVGSLMRSGSESVAVAERWIAEQGTNPFFFMLHLFEPHAPYEAPEPFRSQFKDAYDAEIAVTDAIVGSFLATLKSKGLYDDAIIIIVADHGEGLRDHGEEEHGIFLYREAIQVPLLVKLPRNERAGTTVTAPAGHIDLFPTIAALTGAPLPEGLEGTSLLEIAGKPARSIYAESLYPRIHLGWSDLRSLVNDKYHFIRAPRSELYDAVNDRKEVKNILADQRRIAAAMRQEVEKRVTEKDNIKVNIDPEEAKRLAALGYLGSTAEASGPLPDPKDHIKELDGMALVRTAEQHARTGQFREALDAYRRAGELAPKLLADNAAQIAELHLVMGRVSEAAKTAREALATNPAGGHLVLGRIALSRGDAATAKKEAEAALAASPKDANAGVLLAQAVASRGSVAEALRTLDEVDAQHDQPVPLLQFLRGDLLARSGRIPEARSAFENATREFPGDRNAYGSLAMLHLLGGNVAGAEEALEKMAANLPGPDSYLFAARIFEDAGDRQRAARWRARAR